MAKKDGCEICGGPVIITRYGTECGHPLYLCEVCRFQCLGALKLCLKCEDGDTATRIKKGRL